MGQETSDQPIVDINYVQTLKDHINEHQGINSNDTYIGSAPIKHEGEKLPHDTELLNKDLHDLKNDDTSEILNKIKKEIAETEQALKQIELQIARGRAENASSIYNDDHDNGAKNSSETEQDIRTKFIYQERLEFLN